MSGAASGRYRVERELSRGGIGVVQRARDLTLDRDVALKRLLPKRATEPAVVRLFEREYQTLRGLSHPSVIEVYDYGVDASGPYYTMELLDGRDLHESARLPWRTACAHLRDVASSLALLHARRLLHRDVSPRNVRVTAVGRAKLIDFGSLSSFGRAPNVLGTPPCVPPEALSLAALDQRSDLYALGAVAYFVLTGRHAYPVRALSDLRRAWQQPIAAPSALAPDVPAQLDDLVLSLMRLDPLARPASAGEVIIRLNAIAELAADVTLDRGASYLLNPHLVGRAKELAALRSHAHEACAGQGRTILVTGDEGVGKSRLLHEFLLECQLLGYCVVHSDALSDQTPYGLARSLGRGLHQAAPSLVQQAFAAHRGVLAHLLPEIAGGDPAVAAPLPHDPAERRARIQTAFIEGLLAVNREMPLALGIDDLHAVDSGSAAIIAALSRKLEKRMLLVASARSEKVAGAVALAAHAVHVQLGPLRPAETDALVRSLFGDVPEVVRLARRLHALSAGNPLLCMELARHAVEREVVRFTEGTWVVAADMKHGLPASLAESWSARLERLPTGARALLEVLCVESHAIPIELCSGLARDMSAGEIYDGLDELVSAGVLTLAAGSYRFAHDSLREHVRAALPGERLRTLHRHAADAVLQASSLHGDVRAQLLSAEHLMRAGEELAGAERLAGLAYDIVYASDLLPSAAESLQRAVEICERHRLSPYRYLWLMVGVCGCGWVLDPAYRLRNQDRVLEVLGQVTGLALARKLRPWLGARLSVLSAIAFTSVSTLWARRDTPFRDFKLVFTALSRSASALMASAAVCMDVKVVSRIVATLEPLAALGPKTVGGFVFDYCRKMGFLIQGREAECLPLCLENLALLENPAALAEFPANVRKVNYAGVHHTMGIVRALACDPRALECAEVMIRSGLAIERSMAGQIRVLYYAARGEYERVRAELERVEVDAIQSGSVWVNEVLLPIMLMTSYELAEDVLGLQQASESLRRWARTIPTLELYDDAARLLFLLARGRHADALATLETWNARAAPHERIGWAYGRAAQVKALNALGEHARARREGEQAIAQLHPGDREYSALYLELERQTAMSEAGLGEYAAARARLADLIALHEHRDNPLHLGLLHESLAQIALAERDESGFELHLCEVQRHFRCTRNPRLLQRSERLADRRRVFGAAVVAPAPDASADDQTAVELGFEAELRNAAAAGHGPRDRAARLLDTLLRRTFALTGYLYGGDGDVLELLAAVGTAPSAHVLEELRIVLRIQRELLAASSDITLQGEHSELARAAETRSRALSVVVLPLYAGDRGGPTELVGGLVVPIGTAMPDAMTLGVLAEEIRARPAPPRGSLPPAPL